MVSYTTLSPLPVHALAVCSLWHCPAGHPGWALPTTLPCGARTFLGREFPYAAARPARPPYRSLYGEAGGEVSGDQPLPSTVRESHSAPIAPMSTAGTLNAPSRTYSPMVGSTPRASSTRRHSKVASDPR